MYGKSNMEAYITICKIDSQWEFAVWLKDLTGALDQPRGVGWRGRKEKVRCTKRVTWKHTLPYVK